MSTGNYEKYLEKHHLDEDFDFVQLLKSLQPNPTDRENIEQEIRVATKEIINDQNRLTSLKHLASKIAISNYRILRSEPVYGKIFEIDGVMLPGLDLSTAIYTPLTNDQKDAVSPRLLECDNSISNKGNVKTATEHDFLGEVWVPIMIAIFHQDSDLRVKRYQAYGYCHVFKQQDLTTNYDREVICTGSYTTAQDMGSIPIPDPVSQLNFSSQKKYLSIIQVPRSMLLGSCFQSFLNFDFVVKKNKRAKKRKSTPYDEDEKSGRTRLVTLGFPVSKQTVQRLYLYILFI
ncbi:hypothetical protein BDC45DRAFT_537596 [Circinella umbellata]|nr:hypothetical protein BDC45DRAFT_537596 [Circinella umbellata]